MAVKSEWKRYPGGGKFRLLPPSKLSGVFYDPLVPVTIITKCGSPEDPFGFKCPYCAHFRDQYPEDRNEGGIE
jgi:hypothetical protein